jgi:hypothetical protein
MTIVLGIEGSSGQPRRGNKIVIPTGAKRSGGTCCSFIQQLLQNGSTPLPFVIPSEAEGSAVPLNQQPNANEKRSNPTLSS